MIQIQATIPTDSPERYILRLCKHFSHRVPSQWSNGKGQVDFAMGQCWLSAQKSALSVLCQAENPTDLEEIQETIKSHFDRFAQQEQLVLHWDT